MIGNIFLSNNHWRVMFIQYILFHATYQYCQWSLLALRTLTGGCGGVCNSIRGGGSGLWLCRQCWPGEGGWGRTQGGSWSRGCQHLRWDVVTWHFNLIAAIQLKKSERQTTKYIHIKHVLQHCYPFNYPVGQPNPKA